MKERLEDNNIELDPETAHELLSLTGSYGDHVLDNVYLDPESPEYQGIINSNIVDEMRLAEEIRSRQTDVVGKMPE